jgi:hypothetical protein
MFVSDLPETLFHCHKNTSSLKPFSPSASRLLTFLIHPLLIAGIRSLMVASSSGINPQQQLVDGVEAIRGETNCEIEIWERP